MKMNALETVEIPCNWKHLPHDMCDCCCGWSGPVSSCDSASDCDEFFGGSCVYHICPVCSLHGSEGEIVNYYSSVFEEFEQAFEESKHNDQKKLESEEI